MKIECHHVSYKYEVPGDEWALQDITLQINQGEKIAIVGPTGSGKTTLIQLLDALILPVKGDVLFDGISVKKISKAKSLPSIRRRIGVLFQFPEHQFFQETAYDELAFAARNFFNPDESEIENRAYDIVERLNLDIATLKQLSPFHLSSGEKRKLALASSLMISPEVLILDEPTAGMDALGRREFLRIIASLKDTTVIIVTHNQEDFLGIIDRVIALKSGLKILDSTRDELIDHLSLLEKSHIVPPLVLKVQEWLKASGVSIDQTYFEIEDLIEHLRTKICRTTL